MQGNNTKSCVDPEMTERLKLAIKEKYKSKAKFAAAIGATYEAVRKWCEGESKPNTDFLTAIAKNTTISVDWLLTGAENSNYEFMCGWDEKSQDYCKKLKEILDSNDKFAVPAILSNIDAFRDSVEKNERLNKLEKAVNELRRKELYNKKLASLKLSSDTD